jgi:transcriptional regulator with XRE-family HTH domain
VAPAGGISLAHQYRIESGERTPDGLYLVKVAAYLGVSLDELCGAQAQGTTSPKRVAKQTEHKEPASVQVGNMTNHATGGVQVGYAGGQVKTKVITKAKPKE